jgi:hypothetical protein
MHRDADETDAHFFQFLKMIFAPVSLVLNLVGIGNGHATEQNRFAVGIDKFVSLHPDSRKRVGLIGTERPAIRLIMPPLMVVIRLICLLGIGVREPEQRETDAGNEME